MRNSTPAERTHLFSFSFGMMLLAGMAGSIGSGKMVMVISGWTGDIILGYQITLYLGIVVALAALIPFFLIKSSKPSEEERRISLSYRQLKERGRFYFKITISNFIIGAGAGLIIPFLNLYFRDLVLGEGATIIGDTVAIPEPSSLMLLLLGVFGVVNRQRDKNH